MGTKKRTITYEVIFYEEQTLNGIIFSAGTPYKFYTDSEHSHKYDQFDDAYNHLHRLFGLIDGDFYTAFLPLVQDPVIISTVVVNL